MEKQEEKIWGAYNTIDNVEMLDTLDEIDIWKKIENLGGYIFWARHDIGKNWTAHISLKDLEDAQYNLEYLVYYTRKFGVEFSKEPSATEHIERSKSYDAWFRFWHEHFDSMSYETYNKFIEDKSNGKDISKYIPVSSWKDSLEQTLSKRL